MAVANFKVLCGNLPGPVAFDVLGLCSGYFTHFKGCVNRFRVALMCQILPT